MASAVYKNAGSADCGSCADDAADHWRGNSKPEFQRFTGAGIRVVVFDAGRSGTLWSALIPSGAAYRRNRHSHGAGSPAGEILRLILLDGMRPVLFGLILGLMGGAVAGMLIKSILYGTRPLDPIVFAGMVGSLLLTAAIASAVPALRASRIEPTQALRTE
jgi:hypothetical protein